MSHFTVLVISNPDENPEDLLAPFQEGSEDDVDGGNFNFDIEYEVKDFPDKARQIVDNTDESNKNKAEMIKLLAEGKYKEIIQLEEQWLKEDEEGNLGSSYNMDGHWDWYQLGGRWSGMLKTKKGKTGVLAVDPFSKDRKVKPRHCDQAVFEDIDFEGMLKDKIKDGKNWYKKAIKILEEEIKKGTERDKAIQEANWKTGIDLNEFKSEHDYIESIKKEGFRTFAFINSEGEWISDGDMGWFGCVSGRDIKTYQKAWNLMFKNIRPDQTLSVFDCHI